MVVSNAYRAVTRVLRNSVQVEKFGMDLIKVRELFHPLHTKHMMLMVSALFLHMLFQLWLYQTGRCVRDECGATAASVIDWVGNLM